MSKFKVGDTVKLVSKTNISALRIGDEGIIGEFDTLGRCRVNTDNHTYGNWCELSDLELVKIENKMNEINIKVPEGYVIDTENSTFTLIKFKKEEKKELKCWGNLETINGYYISNNSHIEYSHNKSVNENRNRNIFATKEQAEACIALAMLSQLMKDVNGDWIPNWTFDDTKYVIHINKGLGKHEHSFTYSHFLAFPTTTIRDEFLKNHKELIEQAKSLL